MVTMENSEEILQILERFTRLKQKEIPKELEEYLQYVAKTGDTIFKWSNVKYLFREKLLSVIKHFNEDTQRLEEIPNYPNVDPFNYETMKSSLLERLELFNAAPFTVQRLCELLIDPRKQYSRIDKFMRALEKNILVVSTIDPGRKRTESENGDSLDSVGNGDLSLEVNIDIEMENETIFNNVDERNGGIEEPPSGALKASCPRSDDPAVLPKAKKAKLDYDEVEQQEAEPNAEDVDEESTEPKPKPEAKQADKEIPDTADAVDAADETTKGSKMGNTNAVQEAAEIEEPDDEDEPKSKKKAVNGDKENKPEPDTDVAAGGEPAEAESATADPITEASDDSHSKKSSADAADNVQAKPQRLVGGDERVEKEKEKVAKRQTEKKIDEAAAIAAVAAVVVAEDKEVKEEPSKEQSKAEPDEKTEKSPASEPAPSTPEKAVDSPAGVSKDNAEKVEEKASVADLKAKTEIELEPKQKEAVNETNTEKTETKAAADPAANSATPLVAEIEKDNLAKTAAADAANDAAAESVTAAVPVPDPVPIEPGELATVVATPQSPSPPAADATATATPPADAATFAPSATPTLALNDQPMEDTPAEEENAQVSPTAAVEEVVMAESNAAAGDMATDEAAKDEPAAMEVDDTSQEVMDQ